MNYGSSWKNKVNKGETVRINAEVHEKCTIFMATFVASLVKFACYAAS